MSIQQSVKLFNPETAKTPTTDPADDARVLLPTSSRGCDISDNLGFDF